MKKGISIWIVCCLLILSGCASITGHPSDYTNDATDNVIQTPGPTQSREESTPTETTIPSTKDPTATGPSTGTTEPERTDWECVWYDSYLTESQWESLHGDVLSQCELGNLYALDKETQTVVWLYDASLIATTFFTGRLQVREAIDAERQKGEYVYYILKAEPGKVYRMDYQGTVRDELVYDFDAPIATTCDFEVTFDSPGQDVLVVQYGNQIMVVDTVTKICEVVTENEHMDDLAAVSYSEKGELIIVYNIMILDDAGVAYTVRQYYNVATGETASQYIW